MLRRGGYANEKNSTQRHEDTKVYSCQSLPPFAHSQIRRGGANWHIFKSANSLSLIN
jgi:hypothetical protein